MYDELAEIFELGFVERVLRALDLVERSDEDRHEVFGAVVLPSGGENLCFRYRADALHITLAPIVAAFEEELFGETERGSVGACVSHLEVALGEGAFGDLDVAVCDVFAELAPLVVDDFQEKGDGFGAAQRDRVGERRCAEGRVYSYARRNTDFE